MNYDITRLAFLADPQAYRAQADEVCACVPGRWSAESTPFPWHIGKAYSRSQTLHFLRSFLPLFVVHVVRFALTPTFERT